MNEYFDIGLFRGLITAVLFICFCLIVLWAYSSRRKEDFEEAAQLPFDDGVADKTSGEHCD